MIKISGSVMAVCAAALICQSVYAASINAGEYAELGNYGGEPILWRCLYNDENGAYMISDRVICLKAYSAANSCPTDSYRNADGVNRWEGSSLREWLNSEEETVVYTAVPSENNVSANAYEQEAGFLSDENFTQRERQYIKTVQHRAALNYNDAQAIDNDGEYHIYNRFLETAVQNLSECRSYEAEDRIFLPDTADISYIAENISIFGCGYFMSMPTEYAVNAAQEAYGKLNASGNWPYWLAEPLSFSRNGAQRYVNNNTNILFSAAKNGSIGVRPVCYFDISEMTFASGSGTKDRPYSIYVYAELSADEYAGVGETVKVECEISAQEITPVFYVNGEKAGAEFICKNGENIVTARFFDSKGNEIPARYEPLEIYGLYRNKICLFVKNGIISAAADAEKEGILMVASYNDGGTLVSAAKAEGSGILSAELSDAEGSCKAFLWDRAMKPLARCEEYEFTD